MYHFLLLVVHLGELLRTYGTWTCAIRVLIIFTEPGLVVMPLLPGDYFRQLAGALSYMDFALLALKTGAFGFIIALVTCYHGLAQPLQLNEISRATVRAVGQSTVACILLDALLIIIYLAV